MSWKSSMKLTIIILNFNGGQQIIKCLKSLQTAGCSNKVLVVDNHSTDDSLTKIAKMGFKIIKNQKNLGFSGGCNVGIKKALSHNTDAVLLINQDVIVNKDFLKPLLKTKTGISAPVIKFKRHQKWHYDFGGKIDWRLGRTYHDEQQNQKNFKPKKIDYLSGCCLLIKRKVFKKIGLLDEKFFLYYEDVDFCLRAKRAGFKIKVIPKSIVKHQLHNPNQRPWQQNFYLWQSHWLFIRRWVTLKHQLTAWLYWGLTVFKILWQKLARSS